MKPNYASEDEYLFAKQLQELGIPYKEQVPFVIDEGFVRSNGKRYQDSVYTPDFVFQFNNKTYVIEIKGWSLYDNPFKYRIAEKTFIKLGYEFHKLKLSGSTKDNTLGFYDYSGGTKGKSTENKSSIKGRLSALFFNKEGIDTKDSLNALKRAKKDTYERVYALAEEEWYKEHLDDSEITNEFLEEFITNNYIIIGKGKDETKWKYIKEEQ